MKMMRRRLLVCAPLVSATLVGCLLRPGKSSGKTPGDGRVPADANGTVDANGTSDAIGMPDAAQPADATSISDSGAVTTSCDTGYLQLACACSNASNTDGTTTLTAGTSCSCTTSAFSEAYVHLDGTSGAGLATAMTLATPAGSDGIKDIIGTDVQFLNNGSIDGDVGDTATSMYLGLTVDQGVHDVAGFYATGTSAPPMIGQSGWSGVGSATAMPSFPGMLIISVPASSTIKPPNSGGPGASVTISAVCAK